MDQRIVFSSRSLEDIIEIIEWITKDSPSGAAKAIDKILTTCESLENLASRGRRLEDFEGFETRQLLAYDYRIIYQIRNEDILIATIVHSARGYKKFSKK